MKLEQSFEVAAPIERVWKTLIDVEQVAPCLPGAAVTGRNDDGSYNGTFTVKIGPTTASYSGRLEMENIDEAAHSATMQAQGTDKRGQGGAKATIYSRLAPADGSGTRVDVVTDYHITGRLARFGRGGMIEDISERLLKEFAKRLQSSLVSEGDPAVSPAQPAAPVEAGTAGAEDGGSAAPPPSPPSEAGGTPPGESEVPPPTPPEAAGAPPVPPPAPEAAAAPSGVTPPSPPPSGPPPAPEAAPSGVRPPPPPEPSPPSHQLEASEPMQGLSLVGAVVWSRVKRNPAPVAAGGVAVVLLLATRRRRRR